MTTYYIMQQQLRHHLQQIKCFGVFAALILPVIIFIVYIRSYSEALFHAGLLLAGWATWTFIEYILHRFWMHRKGADAASPLVQMHHHHHTHPTEIKVTPLQRVLMGVLLAALSIISIYLQNYFTFFTGLCFGVVGYFTMHKVIHQPWAGKVFRRLFRYHIYHHCKYPNTCFGISVPWWDDLFKSVPRKEASISPRIIAFYLNEHQAHHDTLLEKAG